MKKTLTVLMMVLLAAMLIVSCDSKPKKTWPTYEVGDTGPAGGLIFYVNPNADADGWKYLEAGKSDLGGDEALYKWGLTDAVTIGTKTDIGEGKNNTGLVAAKGSGYEAANAVSGDLYGNGFKDWFLPSKDELNLMYENLKKADLGSFTGFPYWSSSEDGSTEAWRQDFGNSLQTSASRDNNSHVRPVRMF